MQFVFCLIYLLSSVLETGWFKHFSLFDKCKSLIDGNIQSIKRSRDRIVCLFLLLPYYTLNFLDLDALQNTLHWLISIRFISRNWCGSFVCDSDVLDFKVVTRSVLFSQHVVSKTRTNIIESVIAPSVFFSSCISLKYDFGACLCGAMFELIVRVVNGPSNYDVNWNRVVRTCILCTKKNRTFWIRFLWL